MMRIRTVNIYGNPIVGANDPRNVDENRRRGRCRTQSMFCQATGCEDQRFGHSPPLAREQPPESITRLDVDAVLERLDKLEENSGRMRAVSICPCPSKLLCSSFNLCLDSCSAVLW